MTGREELYEVLNHELQIEMTCLARCSIYTGFSPIDIINNVPLLDGNTIYKMLRQLLICGYLKRPSRGEYYMLRMIPEDLTCKKLELQAKQILRDRRQYGNPPISEDYNYKKNRKR